VQYLITFPNYYRPRGNLRAVHWIFHLKIF